MVISRKSGLAFDALATAGLLAPGQICLSLAFPIIVRLLFCIKRSFECVYFRMESGVIPFGGLSDIPLGGVKRFSYL